MENIFHSSFLPLESVPTWTKYVGVMPKGEKGTYHEGSEALSLKLKR
jgi:hypothetical protein